ncbi:MAG: protease modulator HflC [Treponema sp.]|nr:protease modulator HflC [Treponema sp.]
MMKMIKWIFVVIFAVIILAAGFTFIVREGSNAIVSRFGKIVKVHTEAGLHFKLPWPVDRITVYDTRNQYMDSGYTETLTNDKINIILQTYLVWKIQDAQKFQISAGDFETAQRHLNGIVANAKNSVMGNYRLSSLVSVNLDEIKIDEISRNIREEAARAALDTYGIKIEALEIKRLSLPDANIRSVFSQMIADRQRYVSQYIAEGERDAAKIRSEAETKSAEIFAQGLLETAQIDAETERLVAEIYAAAYDQNSQLFLFLRRLIALENSVNPNTVVIMRADESPFDIITGTGNVQR